MFEQLLQSRHTDVFFRLHPSQLSAWLEHLWANLPVWANSPTSPDTLFLGEPAPVVADWAIPDARSRDHALSSQSKSDNKSSNSDNDLKRGWHHLIYAYLIENTGVFEIFAEVLRRGSQSEALEIQTTSAALWLRTTEELFFRDPPLYSIHGVTSHLRSDLRVVRRNAYWRMFGLDVTHSVPARWSNAGAGTQPWKQDVGLGVNSSFREKLTELMRQVWLGFEHRNTTSGPNPTDSSYVHMLLNDLRDMLRMRRRAGALAREEFYSVAALSWFDAALSRNESPIVTELKAIASTKADRLSLIAQKVGMTPAPRSLELFQLAPQLSFLLRAIELNTFTTSDAAALLYTPADNNPWPGLMNNVVNLWQSATGERVKDRTVAVGQMASAQPLRIPAPQPVVPPRNGELVRGGVQ